MTRKRFVKLVMSRGVSRNDANEIARFVREWMQRFASFLLDVERLGAEMLIAGDGAPALDAVEADDE